MDHPNTVGVATPEPPCVDLGRIPLEYAETLRICVANCLNNGNLWERENVQRAVVLKAMLDLRIGQAQR